MATLTACMPSFRRDRMASRWRLETTAPDWRSGSPGERMVLQVTASHPERARTAFTARSSSLNGAELMRSLDETAVNATVVAMSSDDAPTRLDPAYALT